MNPQFEPTYADLKEDIKALQQRIAEMGEIEIDLHAKIIQLERDAKGPHPHATWQDAAISERMKRMDVNKTVQQLERREDEAQYLIERWLEVDKQHDWTGFQKQVEKYLGVNQKEEIPQYIHYVLENDNFYDAYNKGMGEEFYTKWRDRKDEFPQFNANCVGTWP